MSEQKELMPFLDTSELPAHLKEAGGLGNENVSAEDMTVPRLSLLQALSKQLDEEAPEFVEGAKAGLYFESVSNALYSELLCINLYFYTSVAVFKKRKFGKGFAGNFATRDEAIKSLEDQNLDPAEWDITDTHNHVLLLLDEKGAPLRTVLFSMSSSKINVSRKWNSAIATHNGEYARFASVWKLGTVRQSNESGSWYNVTFDYMGAPDESLFNYAKEAYQSFANTLPNAAKAKDEDSADKDAA